MKAKFHSLGQPLRGLRELLAFAGLGLLGAGCGTVTRSVTHMSTWSGPQGDYFYVAYSEDATTSKVKLCKIQEDNKVSCTEQPELDALLNPK